MNIYEIYRDCFLDTRKHFKIKDSASEIFGETPSVIKNLYILKKYIEADGKIEDPEFKNKDFVIEKKNLQINASSAINNYFIKREIAYAELYLDNEDYKEIAKIAISDLHNFCDKEFSLECFKEAYAKNKERFKKEPS